MPDQLAQSQLLEMGWTKKMIETLLPPPTYKPNPMYKCAAPMKLWDELLVKEVMETEAYKREKERADQRRLASRKGVETRKSNLRQEIASAIQTIEVEIIPEDQLYRRTIRAKQDRYDGFWEYRNAAHADMDTVERWIVNYIRHELTTYDSGLDLIYNRTGKSEVYPELKNAILRKIADAYPDHQVECYRQMVKSPPSLDSRLKSAAERAATGSSTPTPEQEPAR